MLVVVALVALCYCGGNYCPAILKKNKEMLLGGAIALVLCSFFGMHLEGITVTRGEPLPSFRATPVLAPIHRVQPLGGRGEPLPSFQATSQPTPMFRVQPLGGG
jgi:hypothetical protein